MDLPSHPDAGDEAITPAHPGGASWGLRIVIGVLATIFAVVILLHLTGVVGPLAR